MAQQTTAAPPCLPIRDAGRPGSGLGRRYQTVSLLGAGAHGQVYLAEDRRRHRLVAIKLPATAEAGDDLRAEARWLAALRHPHLGSLEDVIDDTGGPAIVETYVPGVALDEFARQRPSDVMLVLQQVCSALAYLHASGCVHGDVKPGNILIDESRRVPHACLVDLGACRRAGQPPRGGTRGFLAPELVAGGALAPATDLFALGVTLQLVAPALNLEMHDLARRLQAESPVDRPTARTLLRRLRGGCPAEAAEARTFLRGLPLLPVLVHPGDAPRAATPQPGTAAFCGLPGSGRRRWRLWWLGQSSGAGSRLPAIHDPRHRHRAANGAVLHLRPWRAARLQQLLSGLDASGIFLSEWADALARHTGGLPGDVLATLVCLHRDRALDLEAEPWDRPPPPSLPSPPAALLRLRRRLSAHPVGAGTRRALLLLAAAHLPLTGGDLARLARARRSDVAAALHLLRRAAAPLQRAGAGNVLASVALRRELLARASPRQRRAAHRRLAAWLGRGATHRPAAAEHVRQLAHAGWLRRATSRLTRAAAAFSDPWERLRWLADLPAPESAPEWRRTVLAERVAAAIAAGDHRELVDAAHPLLELLPESPARHEVIAQMIAAQQPLPASALATLSGSVGALVQAQKAWAHGQAARAQGLLHGINADVEPLSPALTATAERLRRVLAMALGKSLEERPLGLRALAGAWHAAGPQVALASDLVRMLLDRGEHADAQTVAEGAMTAAATDGRPKTLALARSCLGRVAREAGEFAAAVEHYRHALAQAHRARDEHVILTLANDAGIVAKRAGARDLAERYYRLSCDTALRIGDLHRSVAPRLNLAVLARDRGELATAAAECEALLAVAGSLTRTHQAKALAILADIKLRQGQPAACRDLAARAAETFTQLAHQEGLASLSRLRAECALLTGDLTTAEPEIACAAALGVRSASSPAIEEACCLELRLAMLRGDSGLVALLFAEGRARHAQGASPLARIDWHQAAAAWHLTRQPADLGAAERHLDTARGLVDDATPRYARDEHAWLAALASACRRLRRRRRATAERTAVPRTPLRRAPGSDDLAQSIPREEAGSTSAVVPAWNPPEEPVPTLHTATESRPAWSALLEHEILRAAAAEGNFNLLLLLAPAGAPLRSAMAGCGSLVPLDPERSLLLPAVTAAPTLHRAWQRAAASVGAAALGWASYPADGGTADELLRAATGRLGEAPPQAPTAQHPGCGIDLSDLPSREMRETVLALLARLTSTPRPLQHTLELSVELLAGAIGARRGFMIIERPAGLAAGRSGLASPSEPWFVARGGIVLDDPGTPESLVSRGVLDDVLASGEPRLVADAAADPDLAARSSIRRLALRSVLCVPVRDDSGILGALYLDDDAAPRTFTRQHLLLAEAFARRAAGFLRLLRDSETAAQQLTQLRQRLDLHHDFPEIVGTSPAVKDLLRQLERVVRTQVPVLVTGESGTGKELIARAIHQQGSRAGAPFVPINCSAVAESLLESELFGHAKGAFSGATGEHRGLFEAADRGTLFLDEVGDMPLAMQARLLRVLETGRVRRVGETDERAVDVRIVAATHRDLAAMVARREFREDLLYRLRVVHLHVPPLRERPGDVPQLAATILEREAKTMHREVPRVAPATLAALSRYTWPGNIRELVNELRRALVFAGDLLLPEHLSPEVAAAAGDQASPLPPAALPRAASLVSTYGDQLRDARTAFERDYLKEVLDTHDGVILRAAAALGMDRGQLSRTLRRLGVRVRGSP